MSTVVSNLRVINYSEDKYLISWNDITKGKSKTIIIDKLDFKQINMFETLTYLKKNRLID